MSTIKSSAENLTLNADGANNDIKFQSNGTEVAAIDQAGNLTLSGTVDGVDVAARDSVLTSTTATASAALPKAGGSLTGVVDWNNNSVYFRGNATHGYRFNSASDAANLVTIYDNGDTKVWAGDIYFGTAGKGIVLGATTNSAANTLDDYEEGTWTPACSAFTINNTDHAKYTKIGRTVNWSMYIAVSSGSTAGAIITGLPFTCEKYAAQGPINSSSSNATMTNPHFRIPPNSTEMYALQNNDSGIVGNELDGSHIIASGTYMTT